MDQVTSHSVKVKLYTIAFDGLPNKSLEGKVIFLSGNHAISGWPVPNTNQWLSSDGKIYDNVTHWIELPATIPWLAYGLPKKSFCHWCNGTSTIYIDYNNNRKYPCPYCSAEEGTAIPAEFFKPKNTSNNEIMALIICVCLGIILGLGMFEFIKTGVFK